MLIVDRMLVGGIKFVLGKIAAAVDAELNDDSRLREELLAAQMRLELGEMTPEQFAAFENDILARLREIRERQRGVEPAPGEMKVTGVEATAYDSTEE
ncbi:MAG: gas vesicle protein GvpG [Myxococcales bacterium]|nr:gas vesicle protein GvpG [Myxococcales bacterium]